jgi:magnesium-transporting ATPase (P-type)
VRSHSFEKVLIDESNFDKQELSGVLMAKAECVKGSGKAIVTAVGTNTAAGSIDKAEESSETDL